MSAGSAYNENQCVSRACELTRMTCVCKMMSQPQDEAREMTMSAELAGKIKDDDADVGIDR